MISHLRLALFSLLVLATIGFVSNASANDGELQLPIKAANDLEITASTTTWTSLDISADGKLIVFDVLGNLFLMPSEGGTAKQITYGLPFDNQPVFSPDGRKIVFVSDRSGAENLWIANLDGSNARLLSAFADDTSLATPEWSALGDEIFCSRFRPDLNSYEVWSFDLQGEANLIVPAKPEDDKAPNIKRSGLGLSTSPDGKYLFYARRLGGLDLSTPDRWTIVRREIATGREQEIVGGSGARGTSEESYFAPRLSPDGKLLAYAMRDSGKTFLRVRNLTTGTDRFIGEAAPDSLQASAWMGHIPRYDFSQDGRFIVLSYHGRFERRSVMGGQAGNIDRTITAHIAVASSTRIELAEDDGPVLAKLAIAPAPSPDGNSIAFVALGDLHIAEVGKTIRTLNVKVEAPSHPSWSPDGKQIAFVSWSEAQGGAIYTVPANGSKPARRITKSSAYWRNPTFAPDGSTIYAFRSATDARRQSNFEFGSRRKSQLVELGVKGQGLRILAEGEFGGPIHFDRVGNVLFLSESGLSRLVTATGKVEALVNFTGPGWYFSEDQASADRIVLSPDGQQAVALVSDKAYVFSLPDIPGTTIDTESNTNLVRRLGGNPADYIAWVRPGVVDIYSGTRWSRYDTANTNLLAQGRLNPDHPRAIPSGSLLLSGARALTMANGDRVLEHADILIINNRIAAIGPAGSLDLPHGTKLWDIAGKTVMPGLIDVHDHIGSIRRDVPAHELWGLRARLAFGITTSFDPSTLSPDLLEYEGLVDIGRVLGPRLRSTGPAIFSRTRLRSLDETRAYLRRYSSDYGISNIKEYRTGGREIRQWVAIAAREQGLLPTTEGALSLKLDLTQILDGYAGNEHALPALPLGDDVISLMTAMRTSYVTTLSTTNSGAPAKDWMIAHDQSAQDQRVRGFWSPSAIRQKLEGTRVWSPLHTARFPEIAAQAAKLAKAGGLVGIGSHGEAPGIGFHWEMEAHAIGGMAPMAVLHAATAGSAETIGRLKDLGTLEAGKLADLVILDRDPTEDIRNTRTISQVMRGGFLYDAKTLAQRWPNAGPAPLAWFKDLSVEQWLPVEQSDSRQFYGH